MEKECATYMLTNVTIVKMRFLEKGKETSQEFHDRQGRHTIPTQAR